MESLVADFVKFSSPLVKYLVLEKRLGTWPYLKSLFRLSGNFFIS